MENQTLVLIEEVSGKAIVTAQNIFYPRKGEVEITDQSGKIVAGTITNPEILKTLISSFGVTPWEGIAPKLVVRRNTKENTYSLKLASQVDEAKLPKLF